MGPLRSTNTPSQCRTLLWDTYLVSTTEHPVATIYRGYYWCILCFINNDGGYFGDTVFMENPDTEQRLQLCHHHHHHHIVPLARISLTLSRHFSLSFIASGRCSGLHPVSSHRCCMYVRAGRPAFAWPYVGVHRSTSLMSSSLLLQQCPACLVQLCKLEQR